MTQLVVSTNRYSYAEFKCVQSLQNVDWSTISCLIFHSSRDNDVDTILELSKAGELVPKIIYINQQINSLYYGLFDGIDADIYNDETMLADEETLTYLVEDYKKTGMTIKAPNLEVETISKFVATVSKENVESLSKLVKNNLWLQTLESSLKGVETALVRTDEANVGMVEIFNKTSEIIETLQEGQTRTTQEIEKLSEYLADVEKKTKNQQGQNSILFFSTFQVPNTVSKVLYIRIYSPCRYLLSFIESYQHYLKMNKQINSKILIAVPKLKQLIKKYENFTRLATETMNTRGIQNQELLVTHEPKPQVLNAFFNMKTDLYIVIDMMFGDSLLQGAKVIQLNAINGLSDIKRFGLDTNKCIITQMGLNSNIVIPHLAGYGYMQGANNSKTPASIVNKRTKYYENCKDGSYSKLDKLLGV